MKHAEKYRPSVDITVTQTEPANTDFSAAASATKIMNAAIETANARAQEVEARYLKDAERRVANFAREMHAAADFRSMKKVLESNEVIAKHNPAIEAAIEEAAHNKLATGAVAEVMIAEGSEAIMRQAREAAHAKTAALKSTAIRIAASKLLVVSKAADAADATAAAEVPAQATAEAEVPADSVVYNHLVFRAPESEYCAELAAARQHEEVLNVGARKVKVICPREGDVESYLSKRDAAPPTGRRQRQGQRQQQRVNKPRNCRQCDAKYINLDRDGLRGCLRCPKPNAIQEMYHASPEMFDEEDDSNGVYAEAPAEEGRRRRVYHLPRPRYPPARACRRCNDRTVRVTPRVLRECLRCPGHNRVKEAYRESPKAFARGEAVVADYNKVKREAQTPPSIEDMDSLGLGPKGVAGGMIIGGNDLLNGDDANNYFPGKRDLDGDLDGRSTISCPFKWCTSTTTTTQCPSTTTTCPTVS